MWQIYASSWRSWWLPALVQGLLAMACQAWLARTMPPLPPDLSPLVVLPVLTAFAGSSGFWYPLLALLLASLLPFVAHVLLFEHLMDGATMRGAEALRAAVRRYPGALLASVAYVLVVLSGSLLPLVPGVGPAAILLLLPGTWLGGRWLLWPVALVRTGGGLRSLERGAMLIQGRWWRINSWIAIVFLLAILVVFLVEALLASLPASLATVASWSLAAPALPLALVLAARGREFR